MRLIVVLVFGICSIQSMAQCKTFKISSKGDTLNCVDKNDVKRGKWVIHMESLRGNPGYDEEGIYVADRREGIWRRYSLMGDLVSIQNYKWGNLDSISQYYTIAGLEHEESWRAINPDKAYDTLEVQDINKENSYVNVVIKNEGKSMKHGTWKWYRPGSMTLIKSEVYVLNKLKVPGEKDDMAGGANASDSTATAKKTEPKKEKPKEVQEFEKKNSGKKASKVRDGRTG